MTTKELENIAYNYLWKKGWYGVFECAVPLSYCNKYHRERVDFVTYETSGTWRFYEIKISKSDFHSNAALTWLGHYNYYIMPSELYYQVKDEIPKEIGVWVAYKTTYNGKKRFSFECVKKPKRQELKVKHEDMMFAMMQALSREYKKYRKMKEKEK